MLGPAGLLAPGLQVLPLRLFRLLAVGKASGQMQERKGSHVACNVIGWRPECSVQRQAPASCVVCLGGGLKDHEDNARLVISTSRNSSQ